MLGMSPFLRGGRPAVYAQDSYGYGANPFMARRNQIGLLPGVVPIGGRNQLALGGLAGGLGGLAGGFGGLPINANVLPLALGGVNPMLLNGVGGLGALPLGRGRMSSFGGGPGFANGMIAPLRGGIAPQPLANILANRGARGNLIGGNQVHYAYPPAEELITLPVYTQSLSGRRKLGSNGEFLLTIPRAGALEDIQTEILKQRWDSVFSVIVVNVYGEQALLEEFQDVYQFEECGACALIILES